MENKIFMTIISSLTIFTLGVGIGYKGAEYKYLKMYNKELIINQELQNKNSVINEDLESSLLNQNTKVNTNTQINYKTLYWLIKQHPESDCYISIDFKDILNNSWRNE